jgi:phosphomethylpyrimidine synthase
VKTLLEQAREGLITEAMKAVAKSERVSEKFIREGVAEGRIVILQRPGFSPLGIGKGLRTKVNANIGSSSDAVDEEKEIEKARVAEKYGAHTISDLSMGGNLAYLRVKILEATTVPVSSVPIYQALSECRSFEKMSLSKILKVLRRDVYQGISSIVIHPGFTLETLEKVRKRKRIMGIVSKGGSYTAMWMLTHRRENPFLEVFDEILDIAHSRDVVLSLGNTMRSGSVYDELDEPQMDELHMNTELAEKANERGVQVIIEGLGGHIPAGNIAPSVEKFNKITGQRPLYVAGPLPVDVAVGYDHIAACVGGALAAGAGADYLCYITPAEHLNLPTVEQVKEGVLACRIAAHIGDTVKYGLSEADRNIGLHRRKQDWEGQFFHALDGGEKGRQIRGETVMCKMCGRYCALKIMDQYLGG